MEWDAPAIVLEVRPFGEGDAVATVMTEQHGAHRGLARGGASRGGAAVWQPGNLVQARWVGRLAEQLGSFTAELVHPAAALALEDRLQLAVLTASCAVAAGALTDRDPHPPVFAGLLRLIATLASGAPVLADLIRWETVLLTSLGYGLDLSSCPVTGATTGLCYVSPKSGRALSEEGAGRWTPRLLRLPALLLAADAPGDASQWRDGLRLTGHFLARDVFGQRHVPLPLARQALYELVAGMAEAESDG